MGTSRPALFKRLGFFGYDYQLMVRKPDDNIKVFIILTTLRGYLKFGRWYRIEDALPWL